MRVCKIIPNSMFHYIFNEALKYENESEYIRVLVRDKKYNYKKIGLKYDEAASVLSAVYKAAKRMDIKNIMEKSGKTKSEISHLFCIPIRTVEDWETGKRTPPDYIRLMMLRYFNLIKLGDFIYTEYERPIVKEVKEKPQVVDYEQMLKEIRESRDYKSILAETDYLVGRMKRR